MLTVFDGVPRSKQQIDATAGGMIGQARRDGEIQRHGQEICHQYKVGTFSRLLSSQNLM